MGKQAGNIRVLGTIEGLCFYQQEGQYYVKRKPQISRKEFIKYKKYKTQRASSSFMIKSARICSALYKCIPKEIRDYKLLCTLQRQAFWRFKEGKVEDEVIDLLVDQLLGEGYLNPLMVAEAKGLALQSVNKVVNPKGKRAGQLQGVKIRTAEGIWIRLYHMEELELLNRYAEQMQHSDAWLFDFLKKRKQLPFYRDKISRRKRRKSKVVVKDRVLVRESNVHGIPVVRKTTLIDYVKQGESFTRRRRINRLCRSKLPDRLLRPDTAAYRSGQCVSGSVRKFLNHYSKINHCQRYRVINCMRNDGIP